MSFRVKLVLYFLLLSLLPFTGAFVGFSTVARDTETRLVDARLDAALRAVVAAYGDELERAERAAAELARSPAVHRALARRDQSLLALLEREFPSVRIEPAWTRPRPRTGVGAERAVDVVASDGRRLGRVVARPTFDEELLSRLQLRAGLDEDDALALVRDGNIVAASRGLGGMLDLSEPRGKTVSVGGSSYRVVAAQAPGRQRASLAVLSPQSKLDAARRSAAERLLLALGASLALVLLVAYLEGRSIVRAVRRLVAAANTIARGRLSERVPVRGRDELALLAHSFNDMAEQLEARLGELERERRRLREATLRFGEAIAASHDTEQLLRAIVETAVEAAGASGGVVVGPHGEVARAGEPVDEDDPNAQRVGFPLIASGESFGTLILSGRSFDVRELEDASLLVGHAVVALENARLHRIVQRQALIDGLTGVSNRRQGQEALAAELARARRFGDSLAFVLADLDDFKRVNDRYGHPTGDEVLREVAHVLRETVREVDVTARWGGEEFALVLPGTDAAGGATLAERVREALAARTILTPDGQPIRVTASFGVAAYPACASEAALVAGADAALYEAKHAGKDRVATAPEPELV